MHPVHTSPPVYRIKYLTHAVANITNSSVYRGKYLRHPVANITNSSV
jgi:hypothetical protein